MKELLPLLPKPSRYLGSEWGTIRKTPDQTRVRAALAFPDLYEVGMSYMGQRILYEAVNRCEGLAAERVYSPCREAAAVLREHAAPLATMESDIPLGELDAVAFSLTHELCYTNVLFMLDLAGIPLRAAERDESHPLIVAGGGACFNAEPLADFMDVMVIGDGEEALPDLLLRLADAKDNSLSKMDFLLSLRGLPGVYVPSFFEGRGAGAPRPLHENYVRVGKAIVDDLDRTPFPTRTPVPFGAVHDRLTLEIARGCTRGCRFCQAGMLYRPVRERGLDTLGGLLTKGLAETGWEETSFLSLSTGDYSALDALFTESFDRCAAEQVAISLPSLRVGSLSPAIMARMASIRRTGATIAPEAGSQRLRDVINKGVDEEGLLEHVRRLFENGWQSVKLYFMIGLPTETKEDLDAILDLCRKVRGAAGPGIKRLQVTAAVSPFVPKPHTPFQWDRQLTLEEMRERIGYLRSLFRYEKRITLKHHVAEMSYLEGVFSRGDRRLGPVLETAYRKGALFSSWKDELNLQDYLDALAEHGLNPDDFLAARDPQGELPWEHLDSGVSRRFLLAERERALSGKITPDCRYHACRNCGVCNHEGRATGLAAEAHKEIHPRLVFSERDQEPGDSSPSEPFTPPEVEEDLSAKGTHVRLWLHKTGPASFLSQLELQAIFERAFRRAGIPLSFSAGFHPMPRLSFGRALSVGVESRAEWVNVYIRKPLSPEEIFKRLVGQLPGGMCVTRVEPLDMGRKQEQPGFEVWSVVFIGDDAQERQSRWLALMDADEVVVERKNRKGVKRTDVRPLMLWMVEEPDVAEGESGVRIGFDWSDGYANPLTILKDIEPEKDLIVAPGSTRLMKLEQSFTAPPRP
ncbi:TIGR03960 family B12-binding radical SAM protein [Paucidesulfovibrio longus]|uniref:TIGR03960 family B12-binding radical SAM protein n=1 Tax=Paucidesulfovibrio longus TaxID=889 RepID=UPI0003B6BE44|nr:TIGR03960 family B12-binding radical SAM protein [Paucidesulfovibrio longus]